MVCHINLAVVVRLLGVDSTPFISSTRASGFQRIYCISYDLFYMNKLFLYAVVKLRKCIYTCIYVIELQLPIKIWIH